MKLKNMKTFEQHSSELNISDVIVRLFTELSNKHNVDISLIDISLQDGKLVVYSADDKWCRDALSTLERININEL